MKNPLLHRFWIEFEPGSGIAWPPRWACGVTAYSLDDAMQLLRLRVFRECDVPPVRKVVEDVDITTLDRGHVRPNMGVPIWRGVWFPNYGPEER